MSPASGHTELLVHQICRFSVAGIWLYQGLVPKILGPHPDEIAMASAFGVPPEFQVMLSRTIGAGEVVFGVLLIAFHSQEWPQWLSAIGMAVLLAFVALYVPAYLTAPFNPVVMNLASIALSAIAILALRKGAKHEG